MNAEQPLRDANFVNDAWCRGCEQWAASDPVGVESAAEAVIGSCRLLEAGGATITAPDPLSTTWGRETMNALGEYDVLAKIAEGGMGTVYKASHRRTGEVVAIKVLKPNKTDERTSKRFKLEIQATNRLCHPHLVRGIDFGREGEAYYLVMEFVNGVSLGNRIKRTGRLGEAEAVRIITQVGLALHYAHQQGFVHRDIKPDNILIAKDGQAKLTDLGLIKHQEANHDLTRSMSGLGTPDFIAPEQFDNAKNADVRCDIYGLGATLYMAVTGERPFPAPNHIAMLKRKLCNELDPPRHFHRGLSDRVNAAICQALRADPNERYASMPEFLEDLRGAPVAIEPVVVPQPVVAAASHPPRAADRRNAPRYAARVSMHCQPLGGEEHRWKAVVQDISATGLRLLIERRFEPRTMLIMNLLGGRPDLPSVLLARVVRVKRDPSGKWILGGVFGPKLSDDEIVAMQAKPVVTNN